MPDSPQFTIGQEYRRRDLHATHGGQRQGGISTPQQFPVVLLFTGESGEQYGYSDGFQEDGTFWYTGEGQIGDMEMVRGNRAIRDHEADGGSLDRSRGAGTDGGLDRRLQRDRAAFGARLSVTPTIPEHSAGGRAHVLAQTVSRNGVQSKLSKEGDWDWTDLVPK